MNESSTTMTPQRRRSGWRRRLRMVFFGLLPVVAIISLAESVVRVGGYDRPLAGAIFFGNRGGGAAIHQTDSVLFYALKPNVRTVWQGATVTTNGWGLRSAEFGPKQENEYRILSLGESTTFGALVQDDETYSVQLERLLNRVELPKQIRVINAGVSGYSSFQSFKYLETGGLQHQPDLVLFYHEQNDLLPSEYSDLELYETQSRSWHRCLADFSAVYRVISHAVACRQIEAARKHRQANRRLPAEVSDGVPADMGSTNKLAVAGTSCRVPDSERRQILEQLVDVCREHHITVVVIHPSYADSRQHRCVLTEFCAAAGIQMFESQDVLHPKGVQTRALFADECHPNAAGHLALARGLADLLVETIASDLADSGQ